MPDTPTITEAPAGTTEPDTGTTETFTQADVDRIVRERVQRERAKYADYDALKAKAEGAKTVEDRLAEMEKRTAAAEASALRSDVAARHGISAEDRDLLLTGTDAETLEAQAKRIAEASERKKKANIVPREGNNPKATGGDEEREFVRKLFGRATAE
ncbi:MAG: hypothetical protein IPN98_16785 [Propionivibrio sp.]|jgi:hypothetical protein|nr:hypothetical protein [Propionivibrio sp.]